MPNSPYVADIAAVVDISIKKMHRTSSFRVQKKGGNIAKATADSASLNGPIVQAAYSSEPSFRPLPHTISYKPRKFVISDSDSENGMSDFNNRWIVSNVLGRNQKTINRYCSTPLSGKFDISGKIVDTPQWTKVLRPA